VVDLFGAGCKGMGRGCVGVGRLRSVVQRSGGVVVLLIESSELNKACSGCHVELVCPRHGSGKWDGTENENVVVGLVYSGLEKVWCG